MSFYFQLYTFKPSLEVYVINMYITSQTVSIQLECSLIKCPVPLTRLGIEPGTFTAGQWGIGGVIAITKLGDKHNEDEKVFRVQAIYSLDSLVGGSITCSSTYS